jgi:predicted nucleic-acid-binding Zn-ribbon protein
LYLNNHKEIAARGGNVGGDDDFVVLACINCHYQFLYNEEVLDIYYYPNELASSRHLYIDGNVLPPCPGCGSQNFDTENLDTNSPLVKQGPWAWAI